MKSSIHWKSEKRSRLRGGMTLVELMVVITIAVLLIATSVPLMRPALEDGRLRESARQINTFFAIARARAAQLGRPVGVMIERAGPGSNAAFQLYLADSSVPYSGDFVGATVTLSDEYAGGVLSATPDGKVETARFLLTATQNQLSYSATFPYLVQPGDLIQFNYQGPKYTIYSVPSVSTPDYLTLFQPAPSIANPGPDGRWGVAFADDDGDMVVDNFSEAGGFASDDGPSPPRAGVSVPYRIFRQPRKSVVGALQLAGGVAIDLEFSGVGASDAATFDAQNIPASPPSSPPVLDDQPVIIMFSPDGSLSRIYTGTITAPSTISLVGIPVTGTVHLLLGRFDQTVPAPDPITGLSAPSTGAMTNLADLSNVWISISEQTGAVTSSENASGSTIAEAREFARSGQAMGGR